MLDSQTFQRLRRIGLTLPIVQQLATVAHTAAEPHLMRVTEVQRDSLTLHDGEQERRARALPALITRLQLDSDALAVGDWVLAERNTLGEYWAHARVPPQTQLARRTHDGRDKTTRLVIVSNVDTALLVMGLDHDFNLRRLERYLALVRTAQVHAVVVLTKADLCANAQERRDEVEAMLPMGVVALAVNALSDDALTSLAPWLGEGQTLVLVGSSGTGKSTLTNTLLGTSTQDTGANRVGDNRGRHTTTTRSLHVMPSGACIIDTPGLRNLRLDSDASAVATTFDDITHMALQCRFRDCKHNNEPGCAVREAIPIERLRSFHKLLREAERDTLSAVQRKELVQSWKARSRATRARMQNKRGEEKSHS